MKISDYQDSDPRDQIFSVLKQTDCLKKKFFNEALVKKMDMLGEEMKPLFTEKCHFENRDKRKLIAFNGNFGLSGYFSQKLKSIVLVSLNSLKVKSLKKRIDLCNFPEF